MEETINTSLSDNTNYQEDTINWRDLIFKCFLHWPWFVSTIFIAIMFAWLYLHYATPIYKINASVLIKENDKTRQRSENGFGLQDLQQFGIFSSTSNFDNEVEVIHSKTLIKNVIEELGLNITYYDTNSFKKEELYNKSPIEVFYSAKNAENLKKNIVLKAELGEDGSLKVTGVVDDHKYEREFNHLPALLPTNKGVLCFKYRNSYINSIATSSRLEIYISNPIPLAKSYYNALSVTPSSKTTTIALLSIDDSQPLRAQTFINKLVYDYNQNANDDKNEIASKTRQFIDNRISIIDKELFGTEKDLENFKKQSGLTDIKSDAQLALTENSEYNKLQADNENKLSIIKYLNNAISSKNKTFTVLPTQIELGDNGLASQITEYNKLVIDRNRLAHNSSNKNPTIQNLDMTLRSAREAIRATLNVIQKGYKITQLALNKQSDKFKSRINKAPTQERQYLSLSRQQEIKSQLYLMLLQKKEENSIELASTANNAKIIDAAIPDSNPVSPKKNIIYLIAIMFGFALPFGVIYLIDKLRFRIEGHADVLKLTKVPIIGDVPMIEEANRQGGIAVKENVNNLVAETFRSIRTNLQFMLGENKNVIMLTSTIQGEGKTFVATNLAISFSLLGKKVVLIGLDIRKPGLSRIFKTRHNDLGLTQYLAYPETTNLFDLIRPSGISENLSFLPSGKVPPNPTELLDRPALEKAINEIKEKFDYVILDTAPIGLVSDTQLISRVADLTIYVCRADYTNKSDFALIEELRQQKRLRNLCTIINSIDMTQRKYGYYYGYGKYGRYGSYSNKKYGYGYGYDNSSIENKKKKSKWKI